ncbi:hypothetical protein Nepgr_019097 [Nepenthes gracilis]|uniref:Cyclic nucleotide-binding domain-containing protein n=1 Tax=Nepenthes gracilis TaxID=150966 RepID=A0AAD3SWC7_NEPGR|nr:hypothetical protein Nepgr_019097 [Nepenthes gracilis]
MKKNVDSVIEFLGGIPLLHQLPRSSLMKITQVVRVAHYDSGQYVIREGEGGDGIYFIWEGEAAVCGHSVEGRVSELRLHRNDYFGNGGPASDKQGDVIALSKLTCLLLPNEHCILLQLKSIWKSDGRHDSPVEYILHLDAIDENIYRCITLPDAPRSRFIFGGQFIGQALAAASKTVDCLKIVHHLHATFLLAGDCDIPVIYEVHNIFDGQRFANRQVYAMQKRNVVFMLLASFLKEQEGFEHQEAVMPSAPSPDTLLPREKLIERCIAKSVFPLPVLLTGLTEAVGLPSCSRNSDLSMWTDPKKVAMKGLDPWPIEMRFCEPNIAMSESNLLPSVRYWFRAKGKLSDDPALHRCVVAYASDLILLQVGSNPFRRKDTTIHLLSLNHSMWFHRPLKADDWLLCVIESPSSYNGRIMCTGRMFNRKGELVVSLAQEGLIRMGRTPNPTVRAKGVGGEDDDRSRRRSGRLGEMSKKNNLARRKRQHEFDLKREKEEKEKREKKLQVQKNKMKVDRSDKKKQRGSSKFQVGKKKLKTKLTALAKAKAAQAMEIDR